MKKYAVILLSLFLLILLCACSNSQSTITAGTDGTSTSGEAPLETPAPEEYPIHEEVRREDGTLLCESVLDRTDSGEFTMVTTYFDESGAITGMLEDRLDADKILLSSRTLSPEGTLLSEWSSTVREDSSEERITYYKDDHVMVTTDRYFDDLANEIRSVSTTWFGLERETFASPTSDLPERTYTRWSLNPSVEEKTGGCVCYDMPGVMNGEYAYSVADDGSITVTYASYEAESGTTAFTETIRFDAEGTLLSKKVSYAYGYIAESTFADGFEIISYAEEDGRTEYRTDTQTGKLTSVLSFSSDGALFMAKNYNDEGLLVEDQFYLEGTPHGKMLYAYDEAARLIRVETVSTDGVTESVTVTLYDEDGRVSGTEHYDGKNTLLDYSAITYDGNGAVTSETIFAADGKMQKKYEYILDESGVRTGYKLYGEDGKLLDEGSY